MSHFGTTGNHLINQWHRGYAAALYDALTLEIRVHAAKMLEELSFFHLDNFAVLYFGGT